MSEAMKIDQRAPIGTRLRLATFILAVLGWARIAWPDDLTELLRRVAAEFAKADRDGDAQVTADELRASYHGADRNERIRRFTEFDGNADDKLGRSEFFRLLSSAEERGDIFDPIAELEQTALAKFQAEFAAAGGDGAHPLSRGEWPGKQISQEMPAVATANFEQWDKNRDGQVEADEGRWLLEVAYGLTQPDGRPIRTPTGRVLSWYYFRGLDKNQNGVLDRDEFLSGHNL